MTNQKPWKLALVISIIIGAAIGIAIGHHVAMDAQAQFEESVRRDDAERKKHPSPTPAEIQTWERNAK